MDLTSCLASILIMINESIISSVIFRRGADMDFKLMEYLKFVDAVQSLFVRDAWGRRLPTRSTRDYRRFRTSLYAGSRIRFGGQCEHKNDLHSFT